MTHRRYTQIYNTHSGHTPSTVNISHHPLPQIPFLGRRGQVDQGGLRTQRWIPDLSLPLRELPAPRSMGRMGPSQPKSLPCGVFSSLSTSPIPIPWTFHLHQTTLWGGDQAWVQMAMGPKHLSTQVGIKTHKDICSCEHTLGHVLTLT